VNWFSNPFNLAQQATDYWIDAAQRSILFMDVLRERGDERNHRAEQTAPHVLTFQFEVVMDGRHLERPGGLLHILQPDGITPDPSVRSSCSIRAPATVPASAA
jgi:hypothetical protein